MRTNDYFKSIKFISLTIIFTLIFMCLFNTTIPTGESIALNSLSTEPSSNNAENSSNTYNNNYTYNNIYYNYLYYYFYSPVIQVTSPVDSPNNAIPSKETAANNMQVPESENQSENIQAESKPVNYVEELTKLGYYKVRSDDQALDIRTAVILFQADHNIEVDGVWGKQSLSVLQKRMSNQDLLYCDEVADPSPEKKWITVNISKKSLSFYEGKKVIKKYPIAVGNPPSLTPEGKYTIVNKFINPDWGGGGYAKPVAGGTPENPLGYRWMGLSLKEGGSYGIHGNNNPYSIGTFASHGCIRMLNFCVEELFEMVDVNTDVWIGSNSTLESWGVKQNPY